MALHPMLRGQRPKGPMPRYDQRLGDQPARKGFVDQLNARLGARQLIGQSSVFLEMIGRLPIISRCDANVLIRGETGTGKEVCARAIHYLGPRAKAPFIPVNCGAIPVDLMENELFGHEREAFTGAGHSRKGLIHAAANGTLFLDEIDQLSLGAQVKLLRFLQEKEYRPLGSSKIQTSEARVIAATNTNVDEAVEEGRLRQDLYYRLNVLPLELPALRERPEDIPLLARHFAAVVSQELDRQPVPRFRTTALRALQSYAWPGNVRELRHVVERAIILADGRTVIDCHDVALDPPCSDPEPFKQAKAKVVSRFERSYIGRLLAVYEGNISRAARAAGKNRRAFFELVRKHEIDAEAYR